MQQCEIFEGLKMLDNVFKEKMPRPDGFVRAGQNKKSPGFAVPKQKFIAVLSALVYN